MTEPECVRVEKACIIRDSQHSLNAYLTAKGCGVTGPSATLYGRFPRKVTGVEERALPFTVTDAVLVKCLPFSPHLRKALLGTSYVYYFPRTFSFQNSDIMENIKMFHIRYSIFMLTSYLYG